MSTRFKIQSLLETAEADAILLEPETFDQAILGVAHLPDGTMSVAYDRQRCIEIIMADSGCDHEEAEEYFEYNTARTCAYLGSGAPVIIDARYAE
jgi:hypothetical protein